MIHEHGYLRGDLEYEHDNWSVPAKGSLMHVLINHVLTTSSLTRHPWISPLTLLHWIDQ